MTDFEFIKGRTRKTIVVFSVILAIAAVVLIILALMIPNKGLTVSFIGGLVMSIIASFVYGAAQIDVFKDYKSQKKYLCADGILCICVSCISVIALFIFLLLHGDTNVDLRFIIAVLLFAYAIWKIIMCAYAVKEKKNNVYFEALVCVAWILFGICCILFAVKDPDPANRLVISAATGSNAVVLWIMSISGYLLTAAQVVYMLYSYVFRDAKYLECEAAFAIANQEEEDRKIRMGRLATMNATVGASPVQPRAVAPDTTAIKLQKLKKLFDDGLITEDEYKDKKAEILKNAL